MRINKKAGLPGSGRIGRFAKFLAAACGEDKALKIAAGIDGYEAMPRPGKAAWWNTTMTRMERALGRANATEVMASCGRMCCGIQTRKKAKALLARSSSITDFLGRLNKTGMGGGRLILKDPGTITGGYDRCYCGQVSAAAQPFSGDLYCQCSRAWLEQYFGAIFERPVAVTMERTILQGAESCEFTVRLG